MKKSLPKLNRAFSHQTIKNDALFHPPKPLISHSHFSSKYYSPSTKKTDRTISIQRNKVKQILTKKDSQFKQVAKAAISPSTIPNNLPAYPAIQPAVVSKNKRGAVLAYAVNTHQGIQRSYNEDKIAIVEDFKDDLMFFGLFDGHGGSKTAQYLASDLHSLVASQPTFPHKMDQALKSAFIRAENICLISARKAVYPQRSGSCAIVLIIGREKAWLANVGDSRALLISSEKQVSQLTTDHRPDEPSQSQRIQRMGGKLFQADISQQEGNYDFIGPLRVSPGGLSVSRTIGDLQSKAPEYGGKEGVISSQADIFQLQLPIKSKQLILLGCDGIFEQLDNQQVTQIVWNSWKQKGFKGEGLGSAVDQLLKSCMDAQSLDNLSAICIAIGSD